MLDKNLKLYEVEVSYMVPVLARNVEQAEQIVENNLYDISRNVFDPEIRYVCVLTSRNGYESCIPYSTDGDNDSDLTVCDILDILEKRKKEEEREKEIDARQYKLPLFGD